MLLVRSSSFGPVRTAGFWSVSTLFNFVLCRAIVTAAAVPNGDAPTDRIEQPEEIRLAQTPLPNESQLKFLLQFGYLESSGPQALYREDALVNAVKKVQLFGHINQTGVIDDATVQLMKSKRCGVPDIDHEKTRSKRYVLGSKGWNKRTITYYMANWSPQLGEAVVQSEIQRAFDVWGKYGHLTFKRIYNENADIIVKFGRYHHGDQFPFDGTGSILAHAFFPLESTPLGGDIHFDEDETWTTDPQNTATAVNFFAVAIHELGHSLGLAHSAEPDSIMNPYYKGSQQLGYDDIQAMYDMYVARYIPETNETPYIPPGIPRSQPRTSTIRPVTRIPPAATPYTWKPQWWPQFTERINHKPFPPFNEQPPFRPPFQGNVGSDDDSIRRWFTPRYPLHKHNANLDVTEESRTVKTPATELAETTVSAKTSSTYRPNTPRTVATTSATTPKVFTTSSTTAATRTTASTSSTTMAKTFHGDSESVIDHIRHDKKRYMAAEAGSVLTAACSVQLTAAGSVRGELFMFKGKKLWRLKEPKFVMDGYPVEFSRFFRKFPEDITEIDAIYDRCTDSNIIVFSGSRYLIFDGNRLVDGSPRRISDYGIPDYVRKIDAAFALDSVTYLFRKDRVFVFNETSHSLEKVDLIQSLFKNIPDNLDAALVWKNEEIYFFKDNLYWGVDKNTFEALSPYPEQISDFWLNCEQDSFP